MHIVKKINQSTNETHFKTIHLLERNHKITGMERRTNKSSVRNFTLGGCGGPERNADSKRK